MDNVIYSLKEMFSTLALDYCNNEEDVMLPIAAQDLEHYATLNPNEMERINTFPRLELD